MKNRNQETEAGKSWKVGLQSGMDSDIDQGSGLDRGSNSDGGVLLIGSQDVLGDRMMRYEQNQKISGPRVVTHNLAASW